MIANSNLPLMIVDPRTSRRIEGAIDKHVETYTARRRVPAALGHRHPADGQPGRRAHGGAAPPGRRTAGPDADAGAPVLKLAAAWAAAALSPATAAIRVETPRGRPPSRQRHRPGRGRAARASAGGAPRGRGRSRSTRAPIAARHAADGGHLRNRAARGCTSRRSSASAPASATPRASASARSCSSSRFEVAGRRAARRRRSPPSYPSGDSLPANALRLYVHFSRAMAARDAHAPRPPARRGRTARCRWRSWTSRAGLWDPGRTRLTLLFHPGRVKRGVAPGERLGPAAARGPRVPAGGGCGDGGRGRRPPSDGRSSIASGRRTPTACRRAPRALAVEARGPERAGGGAPAGAARPRPARALDLGRGRTGPACRGHGEAREDETRWSPDARRPWTPGLYAVRHRARAGGPRRQPLRPPVRPRSRRACSRRRGASSPPVRGALIRRPAAPPGSPRAGTRRSTRTEARRRRGSPGPDGSRSR